MGVKSQLEMIRRRRVDLLTGGAELDTGIPVVRDALDELDRHVAGHSQSMTLEGESEGLWPELAPFDAVAQAGASLDRLREMAIAWSTPSSGHHGNAVLLAQIREGLALFTRVYGPESPEAGNWWFWEIGIPHALTDLGLLLHGEVPAPLADAVDAFISHYVGNPNVRTKMPSLRETGANRADKASITIKHGVLSGNPDRVAAGRDALFDIADGGAASLFAYVDHGDGVYRDGSYIQHERLAYAGAYGLVTLGGMADLLHLVAGTDWEITADDAAILLDSVDLCYSPFIVDGRMMDCTRGRGVSRSFATDEHMGAVAAGAIARLATLPTAHAKPFEALVRGWLDRHPGLPLGHLPLNQIGLLDAIARDDAIVPSAPLTGHVQTADQERIVHRRGTWAASYSLSSSRRGRFEWGNGENLAGWYQGDGQMQLFLDTDPGAYSGDYWATSDPLHLPGVTNALRVGGVRGEAGTGIPPATADWAGGAGWMGRIGTAGMMHDADGVTAVKSWFCLDSALVCLGAGINGTGGQPVHTTLEARKLRRAEQEFTISPASGNSHRWAHLADVAGYLLLEPAEVTAIREHRTASWRDVNEGGSPAPVSDWYQLLHLNHGVDPDGASYAYAVFPGATAGAMPSLAQDPGFRILANTETVQAMEIDATVLANFFGPATAGDVSVDRAAAVVLGPGFAEDGLVLAVSDPSRHGLPVTITVDRPAAGLGEAAAGTLFDAGPGWFRVVVPTAGTRGHTQTITVRLH